MTADEIRRRVDLIRAMAEQDCEAAHIMEDELHRDVLRYIATKGPPGVDAEGLAQEALESRKIEFTRHCS